MRELRILLRSFYETVSSIKASGGANFIVIGILAATLALFGGALQFNSAIKQISQNLDTQLELSVYLLDSANPQQVATEISNIREVDKVEIINKEVAWQRFQSKFGFSDGSDNPLPNTLHVNIRRPQDLPKVRDAIKQLAGIDQISYAQELFNGLEKARQILFSFGIIVALILGFATIIIVSNTIQIVIKNRALEIEILRLVGVDDWFIRGPFIFHGIFYGLSSALLAVIPLLTLQKFFWDSFQTSIKTLMPATFDINCGADLPVIFLVLILTGVLVCGLSSYFTTEKFIKT